MALNKELLQKKILFAIRKLSSQPNLPIETAQEQFSVELSNLIDEYIKSADIIVPLGQQIRGITNLTDGTVIGTTTSESLKAKIN